MAEPEDLLSKADALMARRRAARTGNEPHAGIPVLEEVVDLKAENDNLPVLTELAEAQPVHAQEEALAASLRATLLAALRPAIDALVEERLKERLSPLVENMFQELRGDMQLAARDILGDAIRTAVQQELDRRKSGD